MKPLIILILSWSVGFAAATRSGHNDQIQNRLSGNDKKEWRKMVTLFNESILLSPEDRVWIFSKSKVTYLADEKEIGSFTYRIVNDGTKNYLDIQDNTLNKDKKDSKYEILSITDDEMTLKNDEVKMTFRSPVGKYESNGLD